jgi:hypothetical protein
MPFMNFIYNTWTFSDTSILEKYYGNIVFRSKDKLAEAELRLLLYVKDNNEAEQILRKIRTHLSKIEQLEVVYGFRPHKLNEEAALQLKISETEIFLQSHQSCELGVQTTIKSFRMSELFAYNMFMHPDALVNKNIVFNQKLTFSILCDKSGLFEKPLIDELKIVRRYDTINLQELLISSHIGIGNFKNKIKSGDTLYVKEIDLKTVQDLIARSGLSFRSFQYPVENDLVTEFEF